MNDIERGLFMRQMNKFSFTAKCLWFLFIIIIPLNIFDVLTSQIFSTSSPAISAFGNYGIIVCNLLYGITLLLLSKEYDFYRIAGICSLFSTIITFWFNCMSGGSVNDTTSELGFGALAISFIGVICNIIVVFFETTGHSDILGRYDYDLSSKWDKLRKWLIISYCGVGSSVVLVFILPIIGLLIMLASLIAILILGVTKFVYLYKTAQVFSKLSKEENVSRETF